MVKTATIVAKRAKIATVLNAPRIDKIRPATENASPFSNI